MNEIAIGWTCPDCGCANTDDFAQTAIPMCAGCDKEFYWDDVLSLDKMAAANEQLKNLLDK